MERPLNDELLDALAMIFAEVVVDSLLAESEAVPDAKADLDLGPQTVEKEER